MGGDVGGFADIGGFDIGSVTDFAADIGSVTTDFGTEYLSSFDTTAFQIPSADIANFGGFDVAGSFAGDAGWFDTFNAGSIIDNIPSVSDFNLPSLPSLPSVGSILSNPTVVGIGSSALGINPAVVSSATRALGGTGLNVGAAASAFGINPTIASTTATAIGVSGVNPSLAALPGVSSVVSGATSLISPSDVVASGTGFRELDAAETAQIRAKVNPLFMNSLVDPGTAQPNNYDNAVTTVQTLSPLIEQYQGQVNTAQAAISEEKQNIASYQAQLDNENLTEAERFALEQKIQLSYDNIAASQTIIDNTQPLLESTTASYSDAAQIIASTDITTTKSPGAVPGQVVVDQYSVVKNTDGTYTIIDNATGDTVESGLTQQQAILRTQDLNIANPGITINTNNGVDISGTVTTITGVEPVSNVLNAQAQALANQARSQNAIRNLRQTKAQSADWRVRLRLAPNSRYLYNDTNPGDLLYPLRVTDGVIFPYTPAIETAYKANYNPYDLTHSNFRGYFYQNSYVDSVNIRGTFTAQDTQEANYLLAVIQFFRSVTKMFYGQDAERGSPPPMVYLTGLGDYQFQEHPCVVSQFNYTLPTDVDYIRAGSTIDNGTDLLNNRIRTTIASNPLSYAVGRLLNSGLFPGAQANPLAPGNLPVETPTYVPTRMEVAITLLPMQSRQQISTQFSLKGFANGNLLKGGFW